MSNKYEVDVKEIELYTTRLEGVDITLILGSEDLTNAQLQSLANSLSEEIKSRGLEVDATA